MHTKISLLKHKDDRVTLTVDNQFTDQHGTEHSRPHIQTGSVKIIEAVIVQSMEGFTQTIENLSPQCDAMDEVVKALMPVLDKNDNASPIFKATITQLINQVQQNAKQAKMQHDDTLTILEQWRAVNKELQTT